MSKVGITETQNPQRKKLYVIFRQPLRNLLLRSLLNFYLKIFHIAAKHFKVDVKPYIDKPSCYKTLSTHNTLLFQLFYNHLKPYAAFGNRRPLPLKDRYGNPVDDWAKLIQWLIDCVA